MPKWKEGDLTQTYEENPYTNRKFENNMGNTKTPSKRRLHSDCGPT